MKLDQQILTDKAIALLQELISIQSFSGEEHHTAEAIEAWLKVFDIPFQRENNNVFAKNQHWDDAKPTLLLNSHHDTVRPNKAYTRDPFDPQIEDGKLFGLGSNDAGGALVSLMATFTYYYNSANLTHNLLMVASAEEENAGPKSLRALLPILPKIEVAIVGEPTLMQLAIAEKGLVVFDAVVKGTPSHAAHPNEDNSIYNTIKVLDWFKNYKFEKVSDALGAVKLTVSQINAGSQHNVVPAHTDLVIDVRVNDCYTNKEVADIIKMEAPCELQERSLRLNSSSISKNHPLVQSGVALGRETYGSPTLSDQAALTCQSMKLGPGDSTRSHSADEFIYLNEIEEGIDIYIKLLSGFLFIKKMKDRKLQTKKELAPYRKMLRTNLTPAEAFLWKHLKARSLAGRRFTKQHSIKNYIVDFYCASEKLIIELVGEVHNNPAAIEYDEQRTEFLTQLGYTVIRFENKMIFDHLESVLMEIEENFNKK